MRPCKIYWMQLKSNMLLEQYDSTAPERKWERDVLERLENTHCTVFYRAHLQFKNPCLWLEMAKYHCFQQCHSNGCKMSATVYSGLWHITQTTREMFEWENRCVSLFREASTRNNCSFYNSYWNEGHKRKAVFSSGNEASTRIQPHSALKGLKV